MKYFYILFAILIYNNVLISQWYQQVSGVTSDLSSVHFFDQQNGIVVGDQGTIIKTSDGGTTWTSQTSGTTFSLKDVVFVNTSDGWAVGNEGIIDRKSVV